MGAGKLVAILILALVCVDADLATAKLDKESPILHSYRTVAPLEDLIGAATRVAKIQLIDRRKQKLADVSCGYVYRAKVLEEFKGGGTEFEFMMTADEDFKGFEVPYLAFVFSRGDIEDNVIGFLNATLTRQERRNISCRLLQDLHTLGSFKTIWSIDPDMSHRFGGEWLDLDTRPVVQWCSAEGSDISDSADQKFVEHDGQFFRVVRWKFARSLILQAIDSSKFLPTTTSSSGRKGDLCRPVAQNP